MSISSKGAQTSCRADSALSDNELHAPLSHHEIWLTEAPTGKDAEGGTYSWRRLMLSPLCRRTA
eukprot:6059076-Amphidinium_carterae.1